MALTKIYAEKFTPIKENVFVSDLDVGMHKTKGGIITIDDNGKDYGIHPRWCKVWAVGPDVKDVQVGEWLLVEHARWTFGIDFVLPEGEVKAWKIEYPKAVLLVMDEDPRETSY